MIRNEAEFAAVLDAIIEDYHRDAAFFSGKQLPEEAVVEELALSQRELAVFLTLSVVPYHVDSETNRPKPVYGRSGLWHVCSTLWDQHHFVYDIEALVAEDKKTDLSSLFGKLTIMDSYDADWWYQTAETLHTEFNGDPREIISDGGRVAPKIERIVKQHPFPGLGDEVSTPLWLRLMHDHVVELTAVDKIDIPLDHPIIEITNRLGDTEFDPESVDDRETLRAYWRVLRDKHGFTLLTLDKPLRLLSHHWRDGGAAYIEDILASLRLDNQ